MAATATLPSTMGAKLGDEEIEPVGSDEGADYQRPKSRQNDRGRADVGLGMASQG